MSEVGCPICGRERQTLGQRFTKEDFIELARKVHGDKYDYSKVDYKGCDEKIEIICPKHGSFWQTPYTHYHGTRCPKCAAEERAHASIKYNDSTIIDKIKEIHGDKYDTSKVNYVNLYTPITLVCKEHRRFRYTSNESNI